MDQSSSVGSRAERAGRRSRRGALLALGVLAAVGLQGCFWSVRRGGDFALRYGGNMPLDLMNDTGVTVCYINMGPSSEPNWGGDWLGPTETLPPGAVRRFGIFGATSWDIRALDCAHRVIVERQGIGLPGPVVVSLRTMTVVAAAQ
jgi:hypothetical protein